jgi:phage shock protein PspC (stress-responsive transcriptional regulator)
MDPMIMRLVFVLGTLIGFGSFILVYLLIWLLAD